MTAPLDQTAVREQSSRGLIMTAVAVIGIGVAVLAWRLIGAHLIGQVEVEWAGPIACEGTQVRMPDTDDEGEIDPTLVVRRDMECILPVEVTNTGPFTVTVEKVILPFMGEDGGPAVQVRELDGIPVPTGSDFDVDAVFRVDRTVEPGATYAFAVPFTFREADCNSEGTVEQ